MVRFGSYLYNSICVISDYFTILYGLLRLHDSRLSLDVLLSCIVQAVVFLCTNLDNVT